jgi:hypothetical protein
MVNLPAKKLSGVLSAFSLVRFSNIIELDGRCGGVFSNFIFELMRQNLKKRSMASTIQHPI